MTAEVQEGTGHSSYMGPKGEELGSTSQKLQR